jgi:tRNA (cmo5U34)-methyltransferase
VRALEVLASGALERVLDLGAGTGLMSAAVAQAFPAARFELLDGSPEMLAEAQVRLGQQVSAVHVQDMAATLPEGPFDAVISALAIHHLSDQDKRLLFAEIHEQLRPGGVFVNAEQVLGPTAELADLYRALWERDAAALGASDAEVSASRGRREHDRCADAESQLAWLREAGFETADCVYKLWELAVIVAVKADPA